MTLAPTRTPPPQRSLVWTCDDCGKRFQWTDRSYWYGSIKDMDEGEWAKITVYCGCRPMPK